MTCSQPNPPQLIEVNDLIYPPSSYERRFLTGWWTRGVMPLDNFVQTNWAGLIIPNSITFEENNISISFPGRWWIEDGCRRSMPKTTISIQYLCKGGRLYLQSQVNFGKDTSSQVYAGHNGASKFSRIPLEKVDEPCSLERTADIPQEKADVIELKHLADWLVTMISAPGVVSNTPTEHWLILFADYTESDLEWAPCGGCIFPTQNWSTPALLSDDNMLQLEARLVVQDVKALGDVLILGTVPEAFNVPLCVHNTYLEVSLPSLMGVIHMRDFFNCDTAQYFTDEYKTIPVSSSDVAKCFIIEQNDWPEEEDPRWEPICEDNKVKYCALGWSANQSKIGPSTTTPGSSFNGVNFSLCSGSYYIPGASAKAPSDTELVLNLVSAETEEWNEIICVQFSGYYGPVQNIGCHRVRLYKETVQFSQASSNPYKLRDDLYAANPNWNCNSIFNGLGQPPPAKPDIPPDDQPQGPNGDNDCFLEGQISYVLNLNTMLGQIYFERTIPFRAKVPQGTANLGPISGTISGTSLTINTALGGSFTADLGPIFSGFNAVGNVISSIVPATFGLRNVRLIC